MLDNEISKTRKVVNDHKKWRSKVQSKMRGKKFTSKVVEEDEGKKTVVKAKAFLISVFWRWYSS